tara:strand:+ start:2160 stop:2783 length:624 start_codon:yes stop_codon:yes gene_type:complete
MNTFQYINKMYKVYEMLPGQDSKQLILEPLSCVLKLTLLQWKPTGTKISVSKNSLHFDEPSLIQGLSRRMTGDSRQDLHNICHPIIKCLEWYPITEYEFFYTQCCKGLETLKLSYDSNSIINHTLDHYIGLLSGKEYEPIEDTAVTGGLRNMWLPKEILILETMLEHILSLDDNIDRDMYLVVFEHLLLIKEDKVNTYIQSISTSYS